MSYRQPACPARATRVHLQPRRPGAHGLPAPAERDETSGLPSPALRERGIGGRPAAAVLQGGFTLVELMVVIVIIGLLAAYVGPRYFAQLGKSERGTAKAQIEGLGKALDAYRLDTGRYPSTEQGLNALVVRPQDEP